MFSLCNNYVVILLCQSFRSSSRWLVLINYVHLHLPFAPKAPVKVLRVMSTWTKLSPYGDRFCILKINNRGSQPPSEVRSTLAQLPAIAKVRWRAVLVSGRIQNSGARVGTGLACSRCSRLLRGGSNNWAY